MTKGVEKPEVLKNCFASSFSNKFCSLAHLKMQSGVGGELYKTVGKEQARESTVTWTYRNT